jgi:hypothetical protein
LLLQYDGNNLLLQYDGQQRIFMRYLKFLVTLKRMAMQQPVELVGAGGQPFLSDRSPSTESGAPARPEGAPDSGGAARVGKGAARGGGWPAGELGLSSAPGGPASSPGSTASLLLERPRPAGGGARPAPGREPRSDRRGCEPRSTTFLDLNFGPSLEKKSFRKGFFAKCTINGLDRWGAI